MFRSYFLGQRVSKTPQNEAVRVIRFCIIVLAIIILVSAIGVS